MEAHPTQSAQFAMLDDVATPEDAHHPGHAGREDLVSHRYRGGNCRRVRIEAMRHFRTLALAGRRR
jgi:hypothetical protein